MSITSSFDPARDSWDFDNFSDDELSWDLYRQTYLDIPADRFGSVVDSEFYEKIFEKCASNGNCVGMSLMALALFKYGGYMGFCAPANFYRGGLNVGPTNRDLHEAMNILHGRQFGERAIRNFIDLSNAGALFDAMVAFNKIKAHLGNGDYVVLSLAIIPLEGEEVHGHTVVPYGVEDMADGRKMIYIYDSNYPYNQFEDYYQSGQIRLEIPNPDEPTKWQYIPKTITSLGPADYPIENVKWCIALPMSVMLPKCHHAASDISLLCSSGTGAAVGQIEDITGRRFYQTEADGHVWLTELETDPDKRLPDAIRWPWFDQGRDTTPPGELYFLRRPVGGPPLQVTLYGNYQLLFSQAGNLVKVQAQGRRRERARDVWRLSGIATGRQALTLETSVEGRAYDIQQLRQFPGDLGWRSITLQDVRVNSGGLNIHTFGDLHLLEVSSLMRQAKFSVELQQYAEKVLTTREVGRHNAAVGRTVRFNPQDWSKLAETEIQKKIFKRERE